MTDSPNRAYLPAIDHLRAGAALLVLFYHGLQVIGAPIGRGVSFAPALWPRTHNPLMAVLIEGHSAVALFIVLSGFIFTDGAEGRRIAYGPFVLNRLLRIYPLYGLLILVSIGLQPGHFSLAALVQVILPFANLPGGLDQPPFTSMFWTVAVECQFYLIFPLLLVLYDRRGPRFLLLLILTMTVFRLLAVQFGAASHEFCYSTLVARLDQFVIGMMAARLVGRWRAGPRPTGWRRPGRWFPFAIAVMIALLFAYHRGGGWPVDRWWKPFWPTIEGLGWAGLVVTYLDASAVVPVWFARPLAAVGARSYSIYLTHFVFIALVVGRGWFWRPSGFAALDALATTAGLVLPATLALSALTYAAIEQPFLDLRRRYLIAGGS